MPSFWDLQNAGHFSEVPGQNSSIESRQDRTEGAAGCHPRQHASPADEGDYGGAERGGGESGPGLGVGAAFEEAAGRRGGHPR